MEELLPRIRQNEFLIFRDITLADLDGSDGEEVEDEKIVIEEKDMHYEEDENENYQQYDIPRHFINTDKWPRHSKMRCWHCDLSINDYPRFLPQNFTFDGTASTCEAHGAFHTWNCVISYIDQMYGEKERAELKEQVSFFEAKFTGKMRDYIPAAPRKTKMKQYCGDSRGITPKQYNEEIRDLNKKANPDNMNICAIKNFLTPMPQIK